MLPDYPEIKERIMTEYMTRMKWGLNRPPFSDITRQRLFEGNRNRIVRNDGSIDDTEFMKISSEIRIDLGDYESLALDDIIEKIDDCANEMDKQQSKHFYQTLEKAVESTGNSISANGEILTPELIFQALEKMIISFNKDGSPNMPTFMAGPKMVEKFLEVKDQIENTPELGVRLKEIIDKKRSEWNDRESSRKLVG